MRAPCPSNNTILRPRLIERLDRGLDYPLSLIAAPAGSGKSVLLDQWRARASRPLVWLALEEADREPRHALARLAGALRAAWPGLGACEPGASTEDVLVGLLNEAARAPHALAVVVDNGQAVEGTALGEAAGRLLDNLPQQLHLVVAVRREPPWPLPRLRVRGHVLEISGAELCFDASEAAALLQATLKVEPAPGLAKALHEWSDGWAMGLAWGAEALRQGGTLPEHGPALDHYFQAEVLAHEPEAVRAFLLQTSVLERLSAPLCNALTSRSDGQAMLEHLERASLFTIPLDRERRSYRYQRLFAAFLRHTLQRTEPEAAAALQRRAAALQANGR